MKGAGNGMATTSVVLGIVGVGFGLIPVMALVAFLFAGLAIIFGVLGRWRGSDRGRRRAMWGLVLGIIAVGLGILGLVIVLNDPVGSIFEG